MKRLAVERLDEDNVRIYTIIGKTIDSGSNPFGNYSQWLKPVKDFTVKEFQAIFNIDAPNNVEIYSFIIDHSQKVSLQPV